MTRQPQPPGLRHDRMCWRTAAMDVYAGESVRSSVEVVIDDCRLAEAYFPAREYPPLFVPSST